jgi:hypothetical protein
MGRGGFPCTNVLTLLGDGGVTDESVVEITVFELRDLNHRGTVGDHFFRLIGTKTYPSR